MSETTPGREPIQIVEIKQPICANVFGVNNGVTGCFASGTADTKCYNTRATCQDTANFALDATPLSLFFSKGKVAEQIVSGANYIIPSLVSVSTSPSKVNYAGSNPDSQGLGNRALCSITFADHQHTDRIVDPYVSGRSWNPLDKTRGSFWTRWMVRNLYRKNIQIVVYEGYAGQALSAMVQRTYFIDKIGKIDSNGRVTITGKDVLARAEERKAQAPKASPGKLWAAMTATQTTIEVANAVSGEYGATGVLRINDELMTYSAVATGLYGLVFTISERGSYDTTAEEHSLDDGVQECAVYADASADTVVADLLTTYAGIDSAWLDTTEWATEVGAYLSLYKFNSVISEPTSVYELISEMQQQALFYLWWDERAALVKLKAVRGYVEVPETLNDSSNIISGAMTIQDLPRERVSQVWTYFNLRTETSAIKEPKSFKNQYVLADLNSESEELYGSASIRKIFSRWINSEPLIRYTSSRIVSSYVDVPQQISFRMDAKDRDYWVADDFFLSHYLDVDSFGNRQARKWTITSAEEKIPGEVVEYTAIISDAYGQIRFIMAGGSADFPGYATAPVKNCYIGSAAGLLSDGSEAGAIS